MTVIPFETLNPDLTPEKAEALLATFGAHYFKSDDAPVVYKARPVDSYYYETLIGQHTVTVEHGDSVWWLEIGEDGEAWAHARSGPVTITSERMAVVVRGYMVEDQGVRFGNKATVLPYVNGCSTRQIMPPHRLGDPTLQHLLIPAYSAEQAHHIHSTVRVVYVLRGKGVSVVGMEGAEVKTELLPGMVCVLDPMSPHHFETPQGEAIEVVPFHVFSAVPGESNHAMFRGTFLMNQGE